MEDPVAVVGAFLDAALRPREVQLAGEAARITGVREELGQEDLGVGNVLAVLARPRRARVAAGQEAKPAWGAHRRGAVGAGEADAFARKAVQVGRLVEVRTHETQVLPPQIIGHNHHDIRQSIVGLANGGRKQQKRDLRHLGRFCPFSQPVECHD